MIVEEYGPTNFHEMNLDWILAKIKELEAKEDGCQCDEEAIKKDIQFLKDQIQSLKNVDEHLQKEIDDLKLPVMLKKQVVNLMHGINFNDRYTPYSKEAI